MLPKIVFVLLFSAFLLFGCAQAPSNGNGTDDSNAVVVNMKNSAFSPETLAVPIGTTVKWVNDDAVVHTVTSAGESAGEFDSNLIQPGSSFRYTFDKPGTYDYFCAVHSFMVGKIIVE